MFLYEDFDKLCHWGSDAERQCFRTSAKLGIRSCVHPEGSPKSKGRSQGILFCFAFIRLHLHSSSYIFIFQIDWCSSRKSSFRFWHKPGTTPVESIFNTGISYVLLSVVMSCLASMLSEKIMKATCDAVQLEWNESCVPGGQQPFLHSEGELGRGKFPYICRELSWHGPLQWLQLRYLVLIGQGYFMNIHLYVHIELWFLYLDTLSQRIIHFLFTLFRYDQYVDVWMFGCCS